MKFFLRLSKSICMIIVVIQIISFPHAFGGNDRFIPKIVLYEGAGGKGLALKSVAKNCPDLRNVNFDNKAQTACITGTWIFYADPLYTNYSNGVSAQFRKDGNCFNFDKLRNEISSFRFAGSPRDFREDTLDLFDGLFFTNIHLRTNQNIPNLNDTRFSDPVSLIVSGRSKWTLFELPNYKGKGFCVTPNSKDHGLPNFYRNELDIGKGSVRITSVRKGCQATPIGESATTEINEIIVGGGGRPINKPKPHKPENKPNSGSKPRPPHNFPHHHHHYQPHH